MLMVRLLWFAATKASAPGPWLDVPSAALPAGVQSICHGRLRRGRAGPLHSQVRADFSTLAVLYCELRGTMR